MLGIPRNGKTYLYDGGTEQANVLEIYLPKQLSEEELTKELKNIIDSLGASSMSEIGRVMGKAMGLLKGKADGSLISKITKELLS